MGGGGIQRIHSRSARLQYSFIKKWVKDSACMHSDLSKSLKLNPAESGCLRGESRVERAAWTGTAGGNAAYRNDSSRTNRGVIKSSLSPINIDTRGREAEQSHARQIINSSSQLVLNRGRC